MPAAGGMNLAGAELRPPAGSAIDPVDLARGQEYRLLSALLARAPGPDTLGLLAGIAGDSTDLGRAHASLAGAASDAEPAAVEREFFDLFIGVGRGELLPYASYYLTGFLQERPLAKVRESLAQLGIRSTEGNHEPEDHVAILCEVMAGLACGDYLADFAAQRRFFENHLKPWAARFFSDLETSPGARFYRAVGAVGRIFIEIETEAFAMDA